MKAAVIICLSLLPLSLQDLYPLKDGKPTRKGIEKYVEDQGESLIAAFQAFVQDTLYLTWIYAEEIPVESTGSSVELGRHYSNEVFITNEELFMAYELADLSEETRSRLTECNLFVKAAVLHELCHQYTDQLIEEMMRVDGLRVDRAYQKFFQIYGERDKPGTRFIEEGICEYLTTSMGEIIVPRKPYIPRKVADLYREEKDHQVYYKYSAYYLKDFLDQHGLREGIRILVHNPPPSEEEILKPESFFQRLKWPAELEQE